MRINSSQDLITILEMVNEEAVALEEEGKMSMTGYTVDNFPLSLLPSDEELICPEPSSQTVQSIKKMGVLVPILLVSSAPRFHPEDPLDSIRLAEGRNRIRISRMFGFETIPARIISPGSALTQLERTKVTALITLIANEHRRENPLSDLAALTYLEESLSPEEIREETGIVPIRYKRKMKLQKLDPHLRHAVSEGKIGVNLAERICSLPPHQQDYLLEKLQEGQRVTHRDVDEITRANFTTAMNSLPEGLFQMDIFSTDKTEEIYDDKQVKYVPMNGWEDRARGAVDELLQVVPPDSPLYGLVKEQAKLLGLQE
jgi:hypothetical protein